MLKNVSERITRSRSCLGACQLDQSSTSNARLMPSQLSLCLSVCLCLSVRLYANRGAARPHKDVDEQFVSRLIESPDAMKPGHLADPTSLAGRLCSVMR